MFSQAKMWIYGITAAVFAAFVAAFQYRGKKIEHQEKVIDEKEGQIKAQEKHFEAREKELGFETQNREAAAKAESEDHHDITDGTYRI